jgi:hypothetical protein
MILGILSNGLHITREVVEQLIRFFTYIRLSYTEACFHVPALKNQFISNLKMLLQMAQREPELRIGLKVLLNSHNALFLADDLNALADALGPESFARLNHIRVKAMRSTDSRQEPTLRDQQFFQTRLQEITSNQQKPWPVDMQVDLDLGYVDSSFRCEISPLFAVVIPDGSLMACYNYVEDTESLTIGNLENREFNRLWGGTHHRKVVSAINPFRVCNSREGCPCRFVKYQRVLNSSTSDQAPAIPPKIAALL